MSMVTTAIYNSVPFRSHSCFGSTRRYLGTKYALTKDAAGRQVWNTDTSMYKSMYQQVELTYRQLTVFEARANMSAWFGCVKVRRRFQLIWWDMFRWESRYIFLTRGLDFQGYLMHWWIISCDWDNDASHPVGRGHATCCTCTLMYHCASL